MNAAGTSNEGIPPFALHESKQPAACMADLHLHGEGPAGAQLCAARRGVAISWRSPANFWTRSGKAREVGMAEVGLDGELRDELRRLSAEHLVPRGVHRVREEFLARKGVVPSFRRMETTQSMSSGNGPITCS